MHIISSTDFPLFCSNFVRKCLILPAECSLQKSLLLLKILSAEFIQAYHLVKLAREAKISSTKHKPAMIPRDVEILYEKKQQVQSSVIVSNIVAGSIQSQVSKKSALMEIQQNRHSVASVSITGSASTSSQVVFGWPILQSYFQHKVLLQLNTSRSKMGVLGQNHFPPYSPPMKNPQNQ